MAAITKKLLSGPNLPCLSRFVAELLIGVRGLN